MTGSSHSTVATDRAARYGKQLASHLGRHHGGEWSDETGTGWIDLGDGRVTMTATDTALQIDLTAADGTLDRLEDVVARHLVRFGAQDELTVEWLRHGGAADG